MQYTLLEGTNPVLLRGAISCGDIYVEDDVTFGPGLTEAYLMEANNAKYPRIILTKDIFNNIKCNNREEEQAFQNFICRDFDAFYIIDYFKSISSNTEAYKNISKRVDYILNTTIDNSIREKYLYIEEKLHQNGLI